MKDNVSLQQYFERILTEQAKRYDELRKADQLAVSAALTAAKEAVLVAEANADKWRASANEWRGAMSDREKTFISRNEYQNSLNTMNDKLLALQKRADKDEGKGIGSKAVWALVITLIFIAIAVIAFFK